VERVTVPPSDTTALLRALLGQPHVGEAVVLSTCNRVDIYAEVSGFHAALAEITGVLGERTSVDAGILADHLHVRHDPADRGQPQQRAYRDRMTSRAGTSPRTLRTASCHGASSARQSPSRHW